MDCWTDTINLIEFSLRGRYAREDTHYLLHIYDLMRKQLIAMSEESEQSDALLVEVQSL